MLSLPGVYGGMSRNIYDLDPRRIFSLFFRLCQGESAVIIPYLTKEVEVDAMRPYKLIKYTALLPRSGLLPAISTVPAKRYSTEQTSPARQPRIPPPVRPTLAVSTEKRPNSVTEYAL